MKKVIGLVLAFVMIMGCVPALAEDTIYENFIIEETEDNVFLHITSQLSYLEQDAGDTKVCDPITNMFFDLRERL